MQTALIPAAGVPVPLTKRELSEAWGLYNLARRHRNGEPVPPRVAHARYTVEPGAITLDLAPAGVAITLKTRPRKASELLMSTAAPDWVPKSHVVHGTWIVKDPERCAATISAN